MANMLRIIDDASKVDIPEPIFDKIKLKPPTPARCSRSSRSCSRRPTRRPATRRQRWPQGRSPAEQRRGQAHGGRADELLLITALPEDMRIEELIAQLDVDIVEPERNYHRPRERRAEDLADALNEFLEDAVQLDSRGAGANSRGGQAPRSSTNSRSSSWWRTPRRIAPHREPDPVPRAPGPHRAPRPPSGPGPHRDRSDRDLRKRSSTSASSWASRTSRSLRTAASA